MVTAARSAEGPHPEGFPRGARLRRRAEFLRVQDRGRRVHTPHLIFLLLPAPAQRLGITVGKKVGTAVVRNRIRRVVREVFRRNRALFPARCELVVVARPGASALDYAAALCEVERAQAAMERALRSAASRPSPS